MTTQSLISFLNSFNNKKLKDNNRTSDTSTIDNFTSFRNGSKQLNMKKNTYRNPNLSLSISNNKTIQNPIKTNHNLFLSQELSKDKQTFNNPSIINYNKNHNSSNSSFNHYNTIDINHNFNHHNHNEIFYINKPSKIKLKNGISKSDFNLSYYNQYEKVKKNSNSNLVNIVHEDNDENDEINFNKYGLKILSDKQKNKLESQISNNDSVNNQLISINSKNDNNSIDMNNEDGFILNKRRKSNQISEFNLKFIKRDSKKKISLDTVNRKRIENEVSNNLNISNRNNSKSRNINKSNTSNIVSNEGSLEQHSNVTFRKTFFKKPRTLILKNPLKIKNSQSENEETKTKNVKSLKFDSDNNSIKGIKEDFMTKLRTHSRKRIFNTDSFYKQKYYNSSIQNKMNDDYIIPNFILKKKEQTPYQISKLKNSLLNKKYLPINSFNYDNQNNNIINFTSSNSEENENENKLISGSESDIENYNDYREDNNNINYNNIYNNKKNNINLKKPSLIENITPEHALSIISQDKNSYISLSKDSIIYIDNPENDSIGKIPIKTRKKRYLKQLSRIPEVIKERISLLDTKFKSTNNVKNEKIYFKYIKRYHSLPIVKINEIKIKFKKKKSNQEEINQLDNEKVKDNKNVELKENENIKENKTEDVKENENENVKDKKNEELKENENVKDNKTEEVKENENENSKDNKNEELKENENENVNVHKNEDLKEDINENLKDNKNEENVKENIKENKNEDSKENLNESLKDNKNEISKDNLNENIIDNKNDISKNNLNENIIDNKNEVSKENLNESLKDNKNEDLKDNQKGDSKKSSYVEFSFLNTKPSNSINFFVKKSSSFEFTMNDFILNKNQIQLNQQSKKLIKYLKEDINEVLTGIKYNLTYNKEDLMKYVAEYKNNQMEEIDNKIEEDINIKQYKVLRFKKELFTPKILSIITKGRIINHFLKRILLQDTNIYFQITLPLFIKDILLENYFNINLYEQIIRSTYLYTDISNNNNEKTIIKNFIRNDKIKKIILREKPMKYPKQNYISISSYRYMNNFLFLDSLEMNIIKIYNIERKSSNKNLISLKKKISFSFFDLKAFTNLKAKKNLNLFRRREKALSTHKTYTNRKDKKKKDSTKDNVILHKNFFNRRRNVLMNEKLNKSNEKLLKQKIKFLKKRGEVLFQSPLNRKINPKTELLIEQSVIKKVFSKESMLYETNKIKSELIKEANTFIDILFLHIKDGNYQNFQDIFQKFNPGINERDENGNSFLNLAVQCCCREIIMFLINKGADINSQNKKLNTALHYALSFQEYDIADLLLKYGADENIKNINGLTPWQCLVSTNSID